VSRLAGSVAVRGPPGRVAYKLLLFALRGWAEHTTAAKQEKGLHNPDKPGAQAQEREAQTQEQGRTGGMLTLTLFNSALEEISKTYRLYLTLSTSAVVVLINTLVRTRAGRLTLDALAISIVAFAFATLACLRLLGDLAQVRLMILNQAAENKSQSEFQSDLTKWSNDHRKLQLWTHWSFLVGMVFAAAFVFGVIRSR
jgi:hypothetical protein